MLNVSRLHLKKCSFGWINWNRYYYIIFAVFYDNFNWDFFFLNPLKKTNEKKKNANMLYSLQLISKPWFFYEHRPCIYTFTYINIANDSLNKQTTLTKNDMVNSYPKNN